jgi:hypothetical protein
LASVGSDFAGIGDGGLRQKPMVARAYRHILTVFEEIPPYLGLFPAKPVMS